MDLNTLVSELLTTGQLGTLAANPAAQFGTDARPLLGATLLPEVEVAENGYREETIKYRSIVANDGTRYSPVQIKGNALTGGMNVQLMDQDTGSEFTARDYDALLVMLRNGRDMDGMAQLIRWVDTTLVRPLLVKQEVMRWQAIVDAVVLLRGDNGYREDVPYSNPSGHRVAIANSFTDDTADPMDFFFERNAFLRAKGYRVTRIVWTTPMATAFANNLKVKQRMGPALLTNTGTLIGATGTATNDQIGNLFRSFGLPVPELYDEQYQTSTGTQFFLKRNRVVFFATTDRERQVQLNPDTIVFLQNTIGYVGLGRAAGQAAPGRVVKLRSIPDSKPPRIEGEAWQTSGVVIQEPEAVAVGADSVVAA